MKACKQYEEILWEAAETGRLDDEAARHLDGCSPCREYYAGMCAAMKGFSALRQVDAPVPALAHLLPQRRAAWTAWGIPAMAAVMVMLMALAFFGAHRPTYSGARDKVVQVIPPPPQTHVVKPTAIVPQVPRRQPAVKPAVIRVASRRIPYHRRSRLRALPHVDVLSVQRVKKTTPPVAPELPVAAVAQPVLYPENISAVSDLPITATINPVDDATAQQLLGNDPEQTRIHIYTRNTMDDRG